jgi:membrane protein implicated in regulation of membrane protease activity
MGLDATARRRWFGALTLVAALLMLIGGETVFKSLLTDVGFLIYWLVCLGFTCLAIVIAFLDVRALGQRVRKERHQLLETTLNQIQADARKKRRRENP